MQSLIHIADKQTGKILDYITESNYWQDYRKIQLNNHRDTFDFTTSADKGFSKYIQDQNRLIIPDPKTGYAEFLIDEHKQKLKRDGSHAIQVWSSGSYLRLKKAKIINPQQTSTETASYHVDSILQGTGWITGQIAHTTLRSFNIEEHTNPYSFLKRLASEFNLELQFRIAIENGYIFRYVDMIERVGRWRGFEVTFGRNLLGIERKSKSTKIITALLGVSPPDTEGNVKTALIENDEALKRWGVPDVNGNLQHLYDVYYPESTDSEMTQERLDTLTENELEKRVNATVEYSTDIATLSNKLGQEVFVGDTVRVKDKKFNPALYLQARVHTFEGSIKQDAQLKIVLGDYIEFTEQEVLSIWRNLRKQVAFKIGQEELANYTYDKTQIDDKDGAILADGKSYAFQEAQAAQDNAENYAYNQYEPTKSTVNTNIDTWNKAGVFNADGTLNVDWLAGQLTDSQIQSAGTWNAQGTYIDENGVYTGLVVAEQMVSGSFVGKTFTGGTFEGSLFEGAVFYSETNEGYVEIQGDNIQTVSTAGDWTDRSTLDISQAQLAINNSTGNRGFYASYRYTNMDNGLSLTDSNYKQVGMWYEDIPLLYVGKDNFLVNNVLNNSVNISYDFDNRDGKLHAYNGLKLGVRGDSYSEQNGVNFPGGAEVEIYPDVVEFNSQVKIDTVSTHNDANISFLNRISFGNFEIGSSQNESTGIGVRPIDNPNIGASIFSVESEGSSTRFKVTHANGAEFSGNIRLDGNIENAGYMYIKSGGNLDLKAPYDIRFQDHSGNPQRIVTGAILTNGFITTDAVDTGASNIYVRPSSSGELRVTALGTTGSYRPARASSFPTGSLEEYKQDIEPWEGSALDIIMNSTLQKYRLISDVENDIDKIRFGYVIGDGYATPEEVIDETGEGVEQYLMNSLSLKAIQELNTLYDAHDQHIQDLSTRVEALENQIA
ncbi:hypothetical protein CEY16_05390 [Halalkalibacillus sediminis]|uniref:Peptidase S74 domain-containing protein n=1 Tax=Halalkalibacillus sediminis TaxID=2018042 RepID=A0A2I0QXX1_9BACI|nr:phage tail spike protein [Halalkalibacillus sediminis]PKR79181.1 hypothetical protein CEY16_05390 [Halalkalibacillus sediminis]